MKKRDQLSKPTLRNLTMVTTELLRRVLTWYGRQSDIVRGSLVAALPSSLTVNTARLILQQMAEGSHLAASGDDKTVDDPETK